MFLNWISVLLIGFSSISNDASPVDNEWMTDYEAAFELAEKEDKYVLINFTGSDWCGWCKKLTREVFSQEAFESFAQQKLVLLKIDFPKYKSQSRKVKVKNQKLAQKFAVRGFPTILLANADEKVVLRTGYKRGGADSYVNHLKEYIK